VTGGSAIGNRFLFQGQLYDPSTGTYSMRARQYNPRWGRFLSPDPLGYSAAPSLYSFTGSRPLSRRDPLGTDDWDWGSDQSVWGGILGGIIGAIIAAAEGSHNSSGPTYASPPGPPTNHPGHNSEVYHNVMPALAWATGKVAIAAGHLAGTYYAEVSAGYQAGLNSPAMQIGMGLANPNSYIAWVASLPLPFGGSFAGMVHYTALTNVALYRGEIGLSFKAWGLSALSTATFAVEVLSFACGPGTGLCATGVDQGRVTLTRAAANGLRQDAEVLMEGLKTDAQAIHEANLSNTANLASQEYAMNRRTVATHLFPDGTKLVTSSYPLSRIQQAVAEGLGYTYLRPVRGLGIHAEIGGIEAGLSNAQLGGPALTAPSRLRCAMCAADMSLFGHTFE
jgi:RHS repeat-associated protein